MSYFFPSDQPNQQREKPKTDIESMFSGLLIGVASLGFAACLLLVLNGKAEKWARQWRASHQAQQTAPDMSAK